MLSKKGIIDTDFDCKNYYLLKLWQIRGRRVNNSLHLVVHIHAIDILYNFCESTLIILISMVQTIIC